MATLAVKRKCIRVSRRFPVRTHRDIQYYNYSHGYQNNYAQLANPDLSRLGYLAASLGMAAYGDSKTKESNQQVLNELEKMDPKTLREAGIDPDNLPASNDFTRMRELMGNLQAFARRREELEQQDYRKGQYDADDAARLARNPLAKWGLKLDGDGKIHSELKAKLREITGGQTGGYSKQDIEIAAQLVAHDHDVTPTSSVDWNAAGQQAGYVRGVDVKYQDQIRDAVMAGKQASLNISFQEQMKLINGELHNNPNLKPDMRQKLIEYRDRLAKEFVEENMKVTDARLMIPLDRMIQASWKIAAGSGSTVFLAGSGNPLAYATLTGASLAGTEYINGAIDMYNIVYHPELGAQPTAAGWATSQFTNNPAAIQTAGTIQNAYSTMTALSLPGVVLAQPALAATATGVAAYLSSPTNINGITNGTAQVLINNTGSPTLTNTLTAFGSGYAMGALGTRLSLGDISLIRLGTRGFFLGFTADSAAQGIELLTDRHPGDNFQVTRAIMNGLGTAFSVSAGGLAGQNPVNLTGWQEAVYKPTVEYMGFAIGKYFNMIPNYVKDENLLR